MPVLLVAWESGWGVLLVIVVFDSTIIKRKMGAGTQTFLLARLLHTASRGGRESIKTTQIKRKNRVQQTSGLLQSEHP